MERQPAQPRQQEANEGRIGRIEPELCPRPAGHPEGPPVQKVRKKFGTAGDHPVERSQRRGQPQQGRSKAQQQDRLHEPEHRHTGNKGVEAGAQPPDHQHREGGRTGAARNAERFPHAAAQSFSPLQNIMVHAAAFVGGVFRFAGFLRSDPGFLAAAGQFRPGQRAHHRREGEFEAHIADGVAVAEGHPDARHAEGSQGIRRAADPDAHCADPDGHTGPEHRGRGPGDPHHQHCHPGTEQDLGAAVGVAAQKLASAPCRGQMFEEAAAEDGDVHSADHQHMRKPCAPVGSAQRGGEM